MNDDLQKFRTRWQRWLGQKCRKDKPYWTTLLKSRWMSWVGTILFRHNVRNPIGWMDRQGVKELFSKAIELADMHDLHKLDSIYCLERMVK